MACCAGGGLRLGPRSHNMAYDHYRGEFSLERMPTRRSRSVLRIAALLVSNPLVRYPEWHSNPVFFPEAAATAAASVGDLDWSLTGGGDTARC